MITKNSTLHIRIPESELKASQNTAKELNMSHSSFVRDAIKNEITATRRSKIKQVIKEARSR